MNTIHDIVLMIRNQPELPVSKSIPFRLESAIAPPASTELITKAWPAQIDPFLQELWMVCGEAKLFVDIDNGQWGLQLLSPQDSATRTQQETLLRPDEYLSGDVVVGEFLGDQELLVLDARGQVYIALPLDIRADWYRPAQNLNAFLDLYAVSKGDKFWEKKV